MIELETIAREAATAHARGASVLLATVVRVSGSSYRRPGARMLVADDRWIAGSVSGGCLEGDVIRRGAFRLRGGKPVLVRYDSASDDDIGWGFGVGCNGVVEVMLEELPPNGEHDPLAFAASCMAAEDRGVMATVFEGVLPVGARLFIRGSAVTTTMELPRALIDAAASTEGRARIISAGGSSALVEVIEPPPRVYIVGAGHDAAPLVTATQALGLRATVTDLHASVSLRERFTAADEVLVASPDELARAIDKRRSALVMLMTHDYERDRAYLGAVLRTRATYIGVLGPERRTARMLAELEQSGLRASDEALARLHAPAGLDLGAETPREIALAIVAEMQAALTGARAGRLRERGGAIHTPIPEDGVTTAE